MYFKTEDGELVLLTAIVRYGRDFHAPRMSHERGMRPSARSSRSPAPGAGYDHGHPRNGLSGRHADFDRDGTLIELEILDAVQFEVAPHPMPTTVGVERDVPTRSASVS